MDVLYRTYQRRVYRQCLRMLRNQADAEDLTQEVFLRLFQKAHTFRGESRFSTWLHRLTFNLVLMELRKQRRHPDLAPSPGGLPVMEHDNAAGYEGERVVPTRSTWITDRVELNLALAQLPSGYRTVFVLHDEKGYGHGEIARFLGVSPGTSKSQLHKARTRLRALLGNDGKPGPQRGRPASALHRSGKQRQLVSDRSRRAAV